MSQALYKVVLSGELHDEFEKDNVIEELSTLFKCPQNKAAGLVSGKPTKLKKEMPKDKAEKYCARLAKAGVKCSIESTAPAPAENLSLETVAADTPAEENTESAPPSGLSLESTSKPAPATTDFSFEQPQQQGQAGLSLEQPQETPAEETTTQETTTQETTTLSLEQPQQETGGLSLEPSQPSSEGLSLESPGQDEESGELSMEPAPQAAAAPAESQADLSSGSGLSLDGDSSAPPSAQPDATEPEDVADTGELVCPKCHTKQPKADQCVKCGIFIEKFLARQAEEAEQDDNVHDDSSGEQEENEILDEFDEMGVFVGDDFDEKYRMRFAELQDNNDEYVRDWDWTTFLIPFPWMLYRKMYVPALVCFIFYIITPFILWPLLHVVSGLAGTYLYYRYVRFMMGKIDLPAEERLSALSAKGGVLAMPLVAGILIASSFLYWTVIFIIFAGPDFAEDLAKVQSEVTAVQDEMQSDIRGMHKSVNEAQALQVAMVKQAINMNIKLKESIAKEKTELPETSEELIEQFQLPPELLVDSWNNPIVYERTKTGYSLRSMGPDAKFLTDDDILVHANID